MTAPESRLPPDIVWRLLGINLLWTASTVAAKFALDSVQPFTLVTIRLLPAGILLLIAAARAGECERVPPRHWPAFLVLGAVGTGGSYALFYTGVARITAAEGALAVACEPVLIALMAAIFLGERLARRQWIGLLIGVCGVLIVAGGGLGNGIAVTGMFVEASNSVLAGRIVRRYSGLYVIGLAMTIGGLAFLPGAAFELARKPAVLTTGAVIGMLYLVLVCAAYCHSVWYRLLKRYEVSALAGMILVQPAAGPLIGWVLRGDRLRWSSAVGAVLVVISIILATGAARRREPSIA